MHTARSVHGTKKGERYPFARYHGRLKRLGYILSGAAPMDIHLCQQLARSGKSFVHGIEGVVVPQGENINGVMQRPYLCLGRDDPGLEGDCSFPGQGAFEVRKNNVARSEQLANLVRDYFHSASRRGASRRCCQEQVASGCHADEVVMGLRHFTLNQQKIKQPLRLAEGLLPPL
jgi:hypothetical protein